MNPALILSIIETIVQDTPAAIALFNQCKAVLMSGQEPTSQQFQDLLAAMATAHAKVQGA